MELQLSSPCKINLLLNILGRRPDRFHELETIMQPVPVHDILRFRKRAGGGVELKCSDPRLPADASNLVVRAADLFFQKTQIQEGVQIELEKSIPMAAGLGGGSGNAATTFKGLNQLFGNPLTDEELIPLASSLGSDIPFFLQNGPALAVGRGEQVRSLESFPCIESATLFLVHPGFGIATAWAYQQLAQFPEGIKGRPGRAQSLLERLRKGSLKDAAPLFYNSLEFPALHKFPVLQLYKDFFTECGAEVALMSGSGSSVFGIFSRQEEAKACRAGFLEKFGPLWHALVSFGSKEKV